MANDDSLALTTRQIDMLVMMCKCLNTKPDVNMDKLATMGGFANANSARRGLNRIFEMIIPNAADAAGGAGGDGEGKTEIGKKKAGGRKRKGATAAAEGEDEAASPKKKAKKATKGGSGIDDGEKTAKEEVKDDNEVEDDGEEGGML